MRAKTEVWSLREGEVQPRVYAPDVESGGLAEHGRIPVGACDRYGDQIPFPNLCAAKLYLAGGIAADHCGRRLQPGRFLDRTVQQVRAATDQLEHLRIA